MIYSMTGFGKGEAQDTRYKITVEIKTVNNRYLDMNVRLPRTFNLFDPEIRALIKKRISRGKADVFVGVETLADAEAGVGFNAHVAGEYVKAMHEMAKEFDIPDDTSVSVIARMPDVFKVEDRETDEDAMRALLTKALEDALARLNEARAKEGAFLVNDLQGKLEDIRTHVDFIKERAPGIAKAYEAKLRERIESLLDDKQIDEARLLTEVAIFADKSGIDEELVRLSSHLDAFADVLKGEAGNGKEGVGRKLDFMVQEMNREANTTLSKASDMEISAHAVEIKTEIEKIREQIQNLE